MVPLSTPEYPNGALSTPETGPAPALAPHWPGTGNDNGPALPRHLHWQWQWHGTGPAVAGGTGPALGPALARHWPGTGTGPALAWLRTGPALGPALALALALAMARHWPGYAQVTQCGAGFCHFNTRQCWGDEDRGLGGLGRVLAERCRTAPAGS